MQYVLDTNPAGVSNRNVIAVGNAANINVLIPWSQNKFAGPVAWLVDKYSDVNTIFSNAVFVTINWK